MRVRAGQSQLVAMLMPYDKRTDIFSPLRFILSDDGLTLTCPHGQGASQILGL